MVKKEFYNKFLFYFIFFYCFLLFISCSTVNKKSIVSNQKNLNIKSQLFIDNKFYSNHFTGFLLFDPKTKSNLIDYNANIFFTPASNVKIITTAVCLSQKMDSIPTFLIGKKDDKIFIKPLADPTFLHPDFQNQNAFNYLKNIDKDTLYIINNEDVNHFGMGWAWDDYYFDFQQEISFFPIYGNSVTFVQNNSSNKIIPDFFENYSNFNFSYPYRELHYNIFYFSNKNYQKQILPFITSNELTQKLLQDTLNKLIIFEDILENDIQWVDTVYNSSYKLVLELMLARSDNFIAEQLLLNAQFFQGKKNKTIFIDKTKKKLFPEISNSLEWVDGSGLSRYNKISPHGLVYILDYILSTSSWNNVKTIFPPKKFKYISDNDPTYIYAKTGTLRHCHALSGYIITKSDKLLIFSFMNNNFLVSQAEVRNEMENVLKYVRDNY